ncbi:MAG: DUF420 domain-containing protein, partial [Rhodospirillaceae bacterium]
HCRVWPCARGDLNIHVCEFHLKDGAPGSVTDKSLKSLPRSVRRAALIGHTQSMPTEAILPHVNAALNTASTILLILGFIMIRSGRKEAHRRVMISAIAVSALFLVSYLIYHFTAPIFVFPGTGWTVPAYYTMLISHVILATLVTPMIFITVWRALHGRFERHKAIARWTLPVWLYVTVTGVAIYVILYHVYPAGA